MIDIRIGRTTLLILVGLAVAAAVLSFAALAVLRRPPSLADSLERAEVLAFIRTPSLQGVETLSKIYGLPALEVHAESGIVEGAIVKRGNERIWITERPTGKKLTDPLSRDPFFRRTPRGADRVLWIDASELPLPEHDAASLVRASLFRSNTILLLGEVQARNGSRGGTILLEDALFPTGLPRSAPALSGTGSRLLLLASEPEIAGEAFLASLSSNDPNLADAVRGILRSQLSAFGEHSSLTPLFREPASLALYEDNTFVLAGYATPDVLNTAAGAVEATWSRGVVRTFQFLGENTRTDIAARSEAPKEAMTGSGWRLLKIPADSMAQPVWIASRDRRFLVGNEEALLTNALREIERRSTPSVITISVDLPWLLESSEKIDGFRREVTEILELLGLEDSTMLELSVHRLGRDLVVKWEEH